ncbi:MAG TPA: tripartite tricarboxylate transporter TctB family protein [Usitatibacter sp.]|nr:tripartite tricarboxylate transporter TctB family protein [Usitatibacter sp.]
MTQAAGKLRAIVPYAALLLVAAWLYGETGAFAALGREGQLSPAFWPRAVLTLLMIVCAMEIGRAALFFRPEKPAAVPHSAAPLPSEEDDGQRYPALLAGGIGLTILYVPGMQYLGFFLATAIYLAAFMLMGRYRRLGVIAVTSVAGSLAFVFVFMKIVYVSLPLGAGPFRVVSTTIMAALGIH